MLVSLLTSWLVARSSSALMRVSTRPKVSGRVRVGRRHTEVVVTVGTHSHIFHAGNALAQVTEEHFIFMGHGVANGIRHVDGGGARLDGSLEDAAQVVPIAASGIFCRKLDGRAEIASVGNHGLDLLERLLGT